MNAKPTKLTPELRLLFKRYGRLHSKPGKGHRGWEVRFHIPFSQNTTAMIRTRLRNANFNVGQWFEKGACIVTPLYGQTAYRMFEGVK